MTIELEKRDFLTRTIAREVLEPGARRTLEPQSFIRPRVHVSVVSEDAVKIVKSFAGEIIEEYELEKDRINKSPHTYSYINRFNISWKKS